MNMVSPYKIPSTSHRRQKFSNTDLDDDSHRERDLKRHQKFELVKPVSNTDSSINQTTNKKRKLEGGSVHEIDEINDEDSDEILHNNNL